MFDGDKTTLLRVINDWADKAPGRQSVVLALDAVETYAGDVALHWDSQREELRRSITSLLTDLHHLSFLAGLDFGDLAAEAERAYGQD